MAQHPRVSTQSAGFAQLLLMEANPRLVEGMPIAQLNSAHNYMELVKLFLALENFDINEDAPFHSACLGRESFQGCFEFLRSGRADIGKRFDMQNDIFRPIYVRRDRRAHHDYYESGRFTAIQLLFSRKDLILSPGVVEVLRELIAIEKRYVSEQRIYLDAAVADLPLPKEIRLKIDEFIVEEGTGALAPLILETDSEPPAGTPHPNLPRRIVRPIRELIESYEYDLARVPTHGGNTLAWARISDEEFTAICDELREMEKHHQPPWHPRV